MPIKVDKFSEDELSVQFPFDQDVVNGLKFEIMRGYRWWNPEIRGWVISAVVWDQAEEVIRKNLPKLKWKFTAEAREMIGTADPDEDSPYGVLCVTRKAPLSVIKAAYKAQARLHHPDFGGSEEAMTKVNEAFETILKKKEK